jgi:hypothetical protein
MYFYGLCKATEEFEDTIQNFDEQEVCGMIPTTENFRDFSHTFQNENLDVSMVFHLNSTAGYYRLYPRLFQFSVHNNPFMLPAAADDLSHN